MRHTLVKLMGLMLALTLVLTGCNLIGIDPIMQLDEDMAKLKKDFEAVVVDYDGGSLTKGDVMGTFVSTYSYYTQMYSMFGMNITSDVLETVKQQALEQSMADLAIEKELANRGLSLTEEQLKEVQEKADENYKQAYDTYYAQAEGKGDVKAKQTEYNMYQNGLTKDTFYNSQLRVAQGTLIQDTVKGEITELSDEELQEAFDAKVAEDEESYATDLGSFESAMSSDTELVTWMPEGYRTVKHILVKPEADVLTAVTDARNALNDAKSRLETLETELEDLNDDDAEPAAEAEAEAAEAETEAAEDAEPARTAADVQADIDAARAEIETDEKAVADAETACLDSVKAKTDEIYQKLSEGVDFADLIAEYGEDPGMQNEPTATRGYYVCADSENWDKNFTAGAMALQNVGDVSETPVISTSGVHIIRYESDVTPGAVALESVRDQFYDTALTDAKEHHYDEALESWISAMKPVYHLDAFTL